MRTRIERCVVRLAFTLLLLAAAMPQRIAAQEAGDTILTPAERVDTLTRGISPRGAMIRSFALWGWGQAAVGSYFRGGVWFSMEATTTYMLFRTIGRLRTAQEFNRRITEFARDSLDLLIATDSLEAERLSNPAVYEQAVSEAPGVATARKLVSARKQQRQDWITYAIFFTLMSGVDGYVNAHLHDFPTTIATEARRDGSLSFSVRVPLPPWLGGTTSSSPEYPRHRW